MSVYVALLRNVNLGQTPSPQRGQLETAFRQAGAGASTSFMSNGTVVYTASESRESLRIARRARTILQTATGLTEPVFVQSFRRLRQLVEDDPFQNLASDAAGRCASFYSPRLLRHGVNLPLMSARQDCQVFWMRAGLALSLVWTRGGHTGYPTPLLEAVLGCPVTTRSWTTIQRLVRHFQVD